MKRTVILATALARQTAAQYLAEAPDNYVVTFSPRSRTLDQNAMFHAICGDIALSAQFWARKPRTVLEWKVLMVSGHAVATGAECEIVAGLEGELVNLRESTADMNVTRKSSLIEYSLAFCALHDIETDGEVTA